MSPRNSLGSCVAVKISLITGLPVLGLCSRGFISMTYSGKALVLCGKIILMGDRSDTNTTHCKVSLKIFQRHTLGLEPLVCIFKISWEPSHNPLASGSCVSILGTLKQFSTKPCGFFTVYPTLTLTKVF